MPLRAAREHSLPAGYPTSQRRLSIIGNHWFWLILIAGSLYVACVVQNLLVTILGDGRQTFTRRQLEIAARYFPASARLQARLAEVELESSDDNSLERATAAAVTATHLLPQDYKLWMILAQIREVQGDLDGQEAALRRALEVAPHNSYIHWQLANTLVRAGKLDESLGEFKRAVAVYPELLPAAVDLIWHLSGGDLQKVRELADGGPESELMLADFLLRQGQEEKAIACFLNLDRSARLSSSRGAAFIDLLLDQGRTEAARRLWFDTLGEVSQPLYNGGFEERPRPGFGHFDWVLGKTDYAEIAVVTGRAHSGKQALRVAFTGKHTTRLGEEIRQLIAVRPGSSYRLEFYAKSESLVTGQGPQVVLKAPSPSKWFAASDPVPAGSNDWHLMTVEFVAPADSSALLLTVNRTPRYSYDEPMSGTVWFDDFVLKESQTTRLSRQP